MYMRIIRKNHNKNHTHAHHPTHYTKFDKLQVFRAQVVTVKYAFLVVERYGYVVFVCECVCVCGGHFASFSRGDVHL